MNKGDHVGLTSTFEALINQIKTKLSTKVDKNGTDRLMTAAEGTKLANIESGAEVNVQSDWNQTTTTADDYIKNKPTLGSAAAKDAGSANGVAELDSTGKVPSSQLPSYVDDVLEYASVSSFPSSGETGKIYVAKDTNKTYRWSGSEYVEISASLALGETSSTAYRGDRGKTAYDFSQAPYTSNPAMNGTASAGSSNAWARGDHVHPKDTSKLDKTGGTITGDLAVTGDIISYGTLTSNVDVQVEIDEEGGTPVLYSLIDINNRVNREASKRNVMLYGTCNTGISVTPKAVTLTDPSYTPHAGDLFVISFTGGNRVKNPEIQINGGTAYPWISDFSNDTYGGICSNIAKNVIVRFDGSNYHTVSSDAPYFSETTKNASYKPLYPFNTCTDAQLAEMIDAYYSGRITLSDVKSVWAVGDKRNIYVNATAGGTNCSATSAQNYTFTILDFDHDTLTTPINGITKALITIGTFDFGSFRHHSSNTNAGGWRDSDCRPWCNTNFFNAISSGIKPLIKSVKKVTGIGNSSTTATTDDSVFMFSEKEVYNTQTYGLSSEGTNYPGCTYNWRYSGNNWTLRSPKSSSSTMWTRSFWNGNFCDHVDVTYYHPSRVGICL